MCYRRLRGFGLWQLEKRLILTAPAGNPGHARTLLHRNRPVLTALYERNPGHDRTVARRNGLIRTVLSSSCDLVVDGQRGTHSPGRRDKGTSARGWHHSPWDAVYARGFRLAWVRDAPHVGVAAAASAAREDHRASREQLLPRPPVSSGLQSRQLPRAARSKSHGPPRTRQRPPPWPRAAGVPARARSCSRAPPRRDRR